MKSSSSALASAAGAGASARVATAAVVAAIVAAPSIGAIPFGKGGHRQGPVPKCLVFELNLVNHIDFPFLLNGPAILILMSGSHVLLVSFRSCGGGNKTEYCYSQSNYY
mmetsp:Transcript_7405/g.10754  ORF Transcript_7405/g.10754 Transcript_7405/m.10754 type:complete len:109 (+) Transcript_7405:273-599(+)